MRPPRNLSNEELAIWREVTRTVTPRRAVVAPAPTPPPEPPTSRPIAPPPQPRRPTADSYSPPMSAPKPKPFAAFERRYRKRVEDGRIDIGGKLDLHGLTQTEAHESLIRFLLRAWADDTRLVLVVTGKGRTVGLGATDAGVLRRAVPHWLNDPTLKGVVSSFEEAGRSHGGAGALYIRLKRRPA